MTHEGEEEDWFGEEDVVARYTSAQAEEDGILVDIAAFGGRDRIQYATRGLLALGYLEDVAQEGGPPAVRLRTPNLVDLVTQAAAIMQRAARPDWLYTGQIELPSGERTDVFICQNERSTYTLLLPEEY